MILTAITFFVILTILVVIHEFGHFMAARIIGVRVEEFGLGLPPRIFGKKFGDTVYSLNWLPIGGFVKLSGEDEDPSVRPAKLDARTKKQYFWARSKKERAVILTAGVFMNFLLAIGITTFLLVHGVKEPANRVHIETVVAGTPAATSGFLVGDVITDVELASAPKTEAIHNIKNTADIIQFSKIHAGKAIRVTIVRGGQTHQLSLTPRLKPPAGQGPMGIAISNQEIHKYSLSEAPVKALTITYMRAKDMLVSLGTTVGRLATLRAPQAEVAGPIGIAQVTGQAVKFGWEAVLEFASILSLNLAVLNILPIPALDGGRLAFVFLEKIFRRRVNPVWERNAHQIGMIILLALIVLVSINDVIRLSHGG
jgi:regulator of sigma E protease